MGCLVPALESTPPTPTTRAYFDFLLRIATLGDYAEWVTALLPCNHERMTAAFTTSSRNELAFLDASWREEPPFD